MKICLCVQDHEMRNWLSLALEAEGHQTVFYHQVKWTPDNWLKVDMVLIEPKRIPMSFVSFYRQACEYEGPKPLIFLGNREEANLELMPHDPHWTLFLPPSCGTRALVLLVDKLKAKIETRTNQDSTAKSMVGFEGLQSLKLSDIIQMLCQSLWTGRVNVDPPQGIAADLWIEKGQITHIQYGSFTGRKALVEILRWGKWKFRFKEGVLSEIHDDLGDWQSLLLDAVRQLDESNHLEFRQRRAAGY